MNSYQFDKLQAEINNKKRNLQEIDLKLNQQLQKQTLLEALMADLSIASSSSIISKSIQFSEENKSNVSSQSSNFDVEINKINLFMKKKYNRQEKSESSSSSAIAKGLSQLQKKSQVNTERINDWKFQTINRNIKQTKEEMHQQTIFKNVNPQIKEKYELRYAKREKQIQQQRLIIRNQLLQQRLMKKNDNFEFITTIKYSNKQRFDEIKSFQNYQETARTKQLKRALKFIRKGLKHGQSLSAEIKQSKRII